MEGVILTPLKNTAYTFPGIGLISTSNPNQFLLNPVLAAGDFQISKNGGAFVNLATLPTVSPAGGDTIVIVLSADEMNTDKVVIDAKDQGVAKWFSFKIGLDVPVANDQTVSDIDQTVSTISSTNQNVLDILEGDHDESVNNITIFKKGTSTKLIEKDITGSLLSPGVVIKTRDT